MTTEPSLPTRQSIDGKGKSGKGTVTGKLKVALTLMIWEGLKRPDAAKRAGLTDHGLREALRKPHVKAFLNSELLVLRESHRPRNILAFVEVRDGKGHKNPMARVAAAKALEGIDDDDRRPGGLHGHQTLPGLVVVLNVAATPAPRPTIDVTPQPRQRVPEPNPNPVFRPPTPRDPWGD